MNNKFIQYGITILLALALGYYLQQKQAVDEVAAPSANQSAEHHVASNEHTTQAKADSADLQHSEQSYQQQAEQPQSVAASDQVLRAFNAQQSDVQVQGHGIVKRVLPDDNEGSRHQKFILALNDGLTILVAHNIDLAPRIDGLQQGDVVEFYGEYEFKPQGGVVHWTHHDPNGRHIDGWLKHQGRTYS